MNAHEMRIEFDGRFGRKWLVLCACGFQHRAKDQLEAEENVAVHRNRFGVKSPFEGACIVFVEKCEALIKRWREARASSRRFLPADHYTVLEHCADELEALMEKQP